MRSGKGDFPEISPLCSPEQSIPVIPNLLLILRWLSSVYRVHSLLLLSLFFPVEASRS